MLAALFSYLWAACCNATLDILLTGGNFEHFVVYELGQAYPIFLISTTVVWAALGLLIAVTGRLFLSCGLLFVASVVAGFANYEKMRLRDEPILPSDLSFAGETGFLSDMVTPSALVTVAASSVLILLITVLVGRVLRHRYPRITRRNAPGLWRGWVVARVGLAVVSLLLLHQAATFNHSGNLVRAAYDQGGAKWAFWFQKVNYLRHGVVAGFLYNTSGPSMDVPPGYSEARMDDIAHRYEAVADRMNRNADPTLLDDLNVVVVLSEAFTDPTAIDGVSLERDPIPYTRKVMRSTPSGTMLAQLFGGGTANMEFEALTSQSLSQFLPQNGSPYSQTVRHEEDYPSLVGYLKSRDHDAVAVHPYGPSMYKRSQAYDVMGFDRFVTQEAISDPKRIDDANFISDETAFDETLAQMRQTAEPDLINLVTMQNHYPFDETYDDPMDVSGVSPDVSSSLGHYARGLEHSDAALRSFLTELKRSEEPTAVVFYGDHQPALWQADPAVRETPQMRQTPFFLWSNVADLPDQQLPLTSPIYFVPVLFEAMGVDIPPYYALLLEMRKHFSAMEQGEYYSPDGQLIEQPEAQEAARQVLEDYRMIQYDYSVGDRYSVERMFPQ